MFLIKLNLKELNLREKMNQRIPSNLRRLKWRLKNIKNSELKKHCLHFSRLSAPSRNRTRKSLREGHCLADADKDFLLNKVKKVYLSSWIRTSTHWMTELSPQPP